MKQQCVWLIGDCSNLLPDVGSSLRAIFKDVRLAPSAEDFLEKHSSEPGGCIICFNELPGMSGVDLLKKLAAVRSSWIIILTSSCPVCETVIDAFRLGAFDYILGPVKPLNLFERVQAALNKSRSLEELAELVAQATLRYQSLTPRERDVLALILAGESNKLVGERLSISEKTVETHRARSMKKLGAENLSALIRITQLIEPSST